MSDYFASLARLLERSDTLYLPGHGPPVMDPQARVARLLKSRQNREQAIVERLAREATTDELLADLYGHIPAALQAAARRTLTAHLIKLEEEGRARSLPNSLWCAVK